MNLFGNEGYISRINFRNCIKCYIIGGLGNIN